LLNGIETIAKEYCYGERNWVATLIANTPAHESSAAVASFRTWPSSQSIIAEGPKGSP